MSPRGDLSLDDRLARIEHKLDTLVEHFTVLRVKAHLFGATAGSVFGMLAAAAVTYLMS